MLLLAVFFFSHGLSKLFHIPFPATLEIAIFLWFLMYLFCQYQPSIFLGMIDDTSTEKNCTVAVHQGTHCSMLAKELVLLPYCLRKCS